MIDLEAIRKGKRDLWDRLIVAYGKKPPSSIEALAFALPPSSLEFSQRIPHQEAVKSDVEPTDETDKP